jgi:hypothetical protein
VEHHSKKEAHFTMARRRYHAALRDGVLRLENGVPSNADKASKVSKKIALGIFERIGADQHGEKLKGQTAGRKFEEVTAEFIDEAFRLLRHLRPGDWEVRKIGDKDKAPRGKKAKSTNANGRGTIAEFEQYRHLIAIHDAAEKNPELAALLGSDYLIKPDIVVCRRPVGDDEINCNGVLVDNTVANLASLRQANHSAPLLHASISCKLTIRSDRSQNSRSEALNLIRNRRGSLPHIMVVTAEPQPSRLASVALGSGDIDCVYHFALPELRGTVQELGSSDQKKWLEIMVNGKRLKDIADLPLDLAV